MKRLANLVAVVALVVTAGPAMAHRVNIFAWVEGDTVHAQCRFPGRSPVMDSTVLVTDPDGNVIAEGKTDDKGLFTYTPDRPRDMVLVIDAGQGHRDEWPVDASEFAAGPEKPPEPAPGPATESVENTDKAAAGQPGTTAQASAATVDEIRAVVEQTVDRKLDPVVRMVAQSTQNEPGLAEILGGIGYILGLVGLATFIHYRKKIKDLGG